jgi:hypothetical protein
MSDIDKQILEELKELNKKLSTTQITSARTPAPNLAELIIDSLRVISENLHNVSMEIATMVEALKAKND